MQFRQSSTGTGRTRKVRAAVLLSVVGVGLASVGMAPTASAGGTSGTVNGCYTQWWNTAFAQKCPGGATQPGIYLSEVACKNEFDHYVQKHRYPGDSSQFDGDDCTFKATNGWINFSWT